MLVYQNISERGEVKCGFPYIGYRYQREVWKSNNEKQMKIRVFGLGDLTIAKEN